MNGRPIPGFYWDPEKKKYFRVQANHVAPAGSQYSKEAVKRRKLDNEQRQRQVAIDRRVRRERVRRSRCMDYVFTRLGDEIGKTFIPGFARKSQQGRVYVSQLQRHSLCSLGYSNVYDFARHGPSGTLVAATCLPNSTAITMCPPASNSKTADVWKYDIKQNSASSLVQYELSSMSLCDSGYLLATYLNGTSGDSMAELAQIPDLDSHTRNTSVISLASTRSLEITFWCSEARPNSSSDPIFAVGTSDGLQTIHIDTTLRSDSKNVLRRPKDVLAVEWLSRTVIASGFRDSLLFLSDLRSNDSVQRIKHPGMIGEIKKIDNHQLVVAGTRSLQMYDLRFPKTEVKTGSKRHRRGGASSTKPYLVFENYNRENYHSMDVNKELGLLATTTEDRRNIRFYSLADGSIVQSPHSLRDTYNDRTFINKIRFEEYQYPMHQRQEPRLLYAQGPDIVELAW
ncbi:hypothetical protein EYB25_005687 [Talaromyces marneffei]|uniref:uncharacterized protein n=1 Tax=Talaromyces marneffei TaxID=37727 RepID=UPI0012AAA8B5|nr:uncharacterized protein EYB26_007019 [Talaromyces marneffei]KAE8551797.1 hypothetical protein EYB25_005687 [Talaromyces marneffei]QGA19330.1 hypothetical protein EYB26_007019 [Talaromyces marneffei]